MNEIKSFCELSGYKSEEILDINYDKIYDYLLDLYPKDDNITEISFLLDTNDNLSNEEITYLRQNNFDDIKKDLEIL